MRISDKVLSTNFLRNIESAQGRVDLLQNQLTTGRRISKPSDDPLGTLSTLRFRSQIASVNQWTANANEALAYMQSEDGILGDATDMLHRIRELAVQGANGTLAVDDRKVLTDEIKQIKEQLKSVANSQIGDKHIFSGTATNKEYLPADGSLSEANTQPILFEVGKNVNINIAVSGLDFFGTGETGVFGTLDNLIQKLEANNSTGVSNALAGVDKSLENFIAVRSDLGARTNRLTFLKNQLETINTNLTDNLASVQDVDLAKAISEFSSAQNVYKAALSVGAKIIQPTLVDYIR